MPFRSLALCFSYKKKLPFPVNGKPNQEHFWKQGLRRHRVRPSRTRLVCADKAQEKGPRRDRPNWADSELHNTFQAAADEVRELVQESEVLLAMAPPAVLALWSRSETQPDIALPAL